MVASASNPMGMSSHRIRPRHADPKDRPFLRSHSRQMAQTFALEGWLGDPRHGGNHEKRSWEWLGFDLACGQNMFRCGERETGAEG